ncbi:MAG: hypothetical protein ACI3VD_05540 [Candidatus Limivicinus sp.]
MKEKNGLPLLRREAVSVCQKSQLCAAPAYTAGQGLPLEGKLAAKPTDEVASKSRGKAETSVKKEGFPPHPPSVRTGHLPLKGKA